MGTRTAQMWEHDVMSVVQTGMSTRPQEGGNQSSYTRPSGTFHYEWKRWDLERIATSAGTTWQTASQFQRDDFEDMLYDRMAEADLVNEISTLQTNVYLNHTTAPGGPPTSLPVWFPRACMDLAF